MKFEREILNFDESGEIIWRAKVIGGWIVKSIYSYNVDDFVNLTSFSVFIPDQEHKWEIDKD